MLISIISKEEAQKKIKDRRTSYDLSRYNMEEIRKEFPYSFFIENYDDIIYEDLKIITNELDFPHTWEDCELPFCPDEFENWHIRSGWDEYLDKKLDEASDDSIRSNIISGHFKWIRFWDLEAPGEQHGHKGVWTHITHAKTGYDHCVHEIFFRHKEDYMMILLKHV